MASIIAFIKLLKAVLHIHFHHRNYKQMKETQNKCLKNKAAFLVIFFNLSFKKEENWQGEKHMHAESRIREREHKLLDLAWLAG